jgi:hydroxymethylpyrimidine/phosphomethylpyrimidine kinase
MPVLLTIAGFDPSSGAGITADLQVFAAHGAWGTACATSLTVQSTRGVLRSEPVSGELIRDTLDTLCADLPPTGIKIGMLGSTGAVHAVASFLREHPQPGPVVLDPVLRSSSGAELLPAEAMGMLQHELLPLVSWLTPNVDELAALTGLAVLRTAREAEAALLAAGQRWPHLHIVCTGGHLESPVDLLLTPEGKLHRFAGERVETTSTHGTGCAFSSSLTARLARGETPEQAVRGAKEYVAEALRRAPGLGSGRGPLGLLWPLGHPTIE